MSLDQVNETRSLKSVIFLELFLWFSFSICVLDAMFRVCMCMCQLNFNNYRYLHFYLGFKLATMHEHFKMR